MYALLISLLAGLTSTVRTQTSLQAEIFALRHQLAVLERGKRRRVPFRSTDWLLWVALCLLWPHWRKALMLVKPESVIAWRRKGFRLCWRWKSRREQAGLAHPIGRLAKNNIEACCKNDMGTVSGTVTGFSAYSTTPILAEGPSVGEVNIGLEERCVCSCLDGQSPTCEILHGDLPKARENKEKGLNLSEFQMKLLEKIEELTLYTVQQAKAVDRKDAEVASLKAENATLNARLSALEQIVERLTEHQK